MRTRVRKDVASLEGAKANAEREGDTEAAEKAAVLKRRARLTEAVLSDAAWGYAHVLATIGASHADIQAALKRHVEAAAG
ncbi:hypothetical protein [Methylobacterium sp. ID0610]|uniref:hypothetical protein n=1 Tax=Methylobacterium carpenticola TaxID=3344827 RepID=UPI00368E10E3